MSLYEIMFANVVCQSELAWCSKVERNVYYSREVAWYVER